MAEAAVGLGRFAGYFLRLGATGFGGPIALAGAMRAELVEERRWVSAADYEEGLALAQLSPGPLAAQLAMYLGFVHSGLVGGSAVAAAFLLPSFLMVWGLAAAYVAFGGLAWVQALFYGVGAAVLGVIAQSAYTLARTSLKGRPLLYALFGLSAAVTALTAKELVWVFVGAGVVGVLAHRVRVGRPARRGVLADAAPALGALFLFFAKAGAFVFGSGLAIVPFLHAGVVGERGWLTERQFLDAVAVAMITPGPVVVAVAFIGYVVAGFSGMCAAAAGVFAPAFVVVALLAPAFRRVARRPAVRAFVEGVTAAAAGAISGAALVLARRALVDGWTVAMAVATLAALVRWKTPAIVPVAAAGALGLWLKS